MFGSKKRENELVEKVESLGRKLFQALEENKELGAVVDDFMQRKNAELERQSNERYFVNIKFRNGNEVNHNNVQDVIFSQNVIMVQKWDNAEYVYPLSDILRVKNVTEKK